jgi:hypothetical protein
VDTNVFVRGAPRAPYGRNNNNLDDPIGRIRRLASSFTSVEDLEANDYEAAPWYVVHEKEDDDDAVLNDADHRLSLLMRESDIAA